jgi:hypothetical protein
VGELFLVKVQAFPEDAAPPERDGFDAAVGWEPAWGQFGPPLGKGRSARLARRARVAEQAFESNSVYDYDALVRAALARPQTPYLQFPCVTPSWDNSVRRTHGSAIILKDATPTAYGEWLAQAVERARQLPTGQRLLFINAWNEWAEGNHLEPDQRWGHAYLDATARALARPRG